ncbi:MAG: M56 family metallopeptidase [Micrococcales bacterium]|nr:M56 family metallopeptidase [Micrococcales bacterium]
MYIAPLIVLAVLLAWPAPRLMAEFTAFRRAPRAALTVWQATAVTALLAALASAPAAVIHVRRESGIIEHAGAFDDGGLVIVLAFLVSGVILARLLSCAHRVGRNIRAVRRRHRELVDILALDALPGGDRQVRLLAHATPTAYCLPGMKRRVVLTQGTIDRLSEPELDAVLTHERAHLIARHDLLLEFFTVVHEAVPAVVRSDASLREVRLLIEVLADRAAVRRAGAVTTAQAIVQMAGSPTPAGSMAIREEGSIAAVRIGLLERHPIAGVDPRIASIAMYAFAATLVLAPVLLLVAAFA